MTLLKAISISRKRLNSFILFFMLLSVSLSAASFRTAVVTDNEMYSSLISDVLAVLQGDITSPSSLSLYEAKSEEARNWAFAKNVSSLRQKESFESLETLLASGDDSEVWDGTLTLELAEVTFSDTEKSFLLQGDEEAFSYLMARENLDLLIAADITEEGMMTESRVFANGKEIHRNLYISSDDSAEFESLLSALMPYFKSDDYVIVRFSVPSVVSLSVDGEAVSLVRSVLVMKKGEHLIRFSSPLYKTVEMTVIAEQGHVVEPVLEEIESDRLFISVLPYDSSIYFQGLQADSHFIGEADVPFQITATHAGFSPLIVQSRVPMEKIELELRPEWMEDENIVERSKDRLYTNLLSTLLSFGCYVASQSLSGIYTETDFAPAVTLFAGMSFVQLVELMDSMIEYYQAARLGI